MSPLRALVSDWCRRFDAPGAAVARFDRTGVVDAAAGGFADLALGIPARPQTAWLWFSVTKVLTAQAALALAEAGTWDLDDPADRWVPQARFRLPGLLGPWTSPTLRQLTAHISGLPDPPPLTALRHPDDPPRSSLRRIERYRRLWGRLHRPPGASARYSNLGYLVLGEALASAAQRPYRDVALELWAPLKVELDMCWTKGLAQHRATGYLPRRAVYTLVLEVLGAHRIRGPVAGALRAYGPLVMDASAVGGLIGSTIDVARWLAGHLDPRNRQAALQRAEVALSGGQASGFGLGWHLIGDGVHHQGSGLGYSAEVRLFPRRGCGVAVACNRSGRNGPLFQPIARLAEEVGAIRH